VRHPIKPLLFAVLFASPALVAQTGSSAQTPSLVELDRQNPSPGAFPIAADHAAAAIYIAPGNSETVRVAAQLFASDVESVTGTKPVILGALSGKLPAHLILAGALGHSPEIDTLAGSHRLNTAAVANRWESGLTETVKNPLPAHPEVKDALVVAGADRRGSAYALLTLSRAMGVSPWTWWADVPIPHHASVYVAAGEHIQPSPSVQYRGIFLNDEDWGLRPWAAKKMDPNVDGGKGNIGPRTYEKLFELLLRLHANSLWPAMHPGSLAFNAVPENAKLADKYGIVMGSSHSEALLRNNVGEWNEAPPPTGNGRWNYQTNAPAMRDYWAKRLEANGRYENFYTVGLRGVHDSGLEATGSREVKAKLVEDVLHDQRELLQKYVSPQVADVPQVIWLYKESLDLYRAGMKVPDDVTLGWTDDNYGYIRELPTVAEQQRPGGSGIYYHVSYWGAPHDHLWLSTTPPALLREELTKAYDHNARKYWILNVGDLKPAELDIDYFMQLAWNEPTTAALTERDFLTRWLGEQFPTSNASTLADMMIHYYALNFIRKPEFMGFNGYNDGINHTAFNPLAWGSADLPDQNHLRSAAWNLLSDDAIRLSRAVPPHYASAFFELVGYPVQAAAAMNQKFFSADLSYLDAHNHKEQALTADAKAAQAAYDTIQSLTAKYNALEGGKWDGMMSAHPRDRHVFEMPRLATMADADVPLPASWGAGEPVSPPIAPGFVEQDRTVSINAAHFARSFGGKAGVWNVMPYLGISGGSVVFGRPGILANNDHQTALVPPPPLTEPPYLEYTFTTTSSGAANLTLHLLPTFPVDSDHRLRYAVSLDDHPRVELDAAPAAPGSVGAANSNGDGPSDKDWAANVLRNSAIRILRLSSELTPGPHTLRLYYVDPGVVFEHIVLTFPGAPPAYPVPPETGTPPSPAVP
jgi:hypothetical protein